MAFAFLVMLALAIAVYALKTNGAEEFSAFGGARANGDLPAWQIQAHLDGSAAASRVAVSQPARFAQTANAGALNVGV